MKTTKLSLASIQGKLSRMEMRNIMAGSCATTYSGCNRKPNGEITCDYHMVCTNGYVDNLCGLQCQNSGDGRDCAPASQP